MESWLSAFSTELREPLSARRKSRRESVITGSRDNCLIDTANIFSGEAMNRRDFMIGSGAGLGAFWPGSKTLTASASTMAGTTGIVFNDGGETKSERTYHVLGVPLRAGSLYPGNENDAEAYREVQLLARLSAVGCKALDEGNVAIPSYLPHHSIPPIRSWPGPRIAWDCVRERIEPTCNSPCTSRC
jgi:arginase